MASILHAYGQSLLLETRYESNGKIFKIFQDWISMERKQELPSIFRIYIENEANLKLTFVFNAFNGFTFI